MQRAPESTLLMVDYGSVNWPLFVERVQKECKLIRPKKLLNPIIHAHLAKDLANKLDKVLVSCLLACSKQLKHTEEGGYNTQMSIEDYMVSFKAVESNARLRAGHYESLYELLKDDFSRDSNLMELSMAKERNGLSIDPEIMSTHDAMAIDDSDSTTGLADGRKYGTSDSDNSYTEQGKNGHYADTIHNLLFALNPHHHVSPFEMRPIVYQAAWSSPLFQMLWTRVLSHCIDWGYLPQQYTPPVLCVQYVGKQADGHHNQVENMLVINTSGKIITDIARSKCGMSDKDRSSIDHIAFVERLPSLKAGTVNQELGDDRSMSDQEEDYETDYPCDSDEDSETEAEEPVLDDHLHHKVVGGIRVVGL